MGFMLPKWPKQTAGDRVTDWAVGLATFAVISFVGLLCIWPLLAMWPPRDGVCVTLEVSEFELRGGNPVVIGIRPEGARKLARVFGVPASVPIAIRGEDR